MKRRSAIQFFLGMSLTAQFSSTYAKELLEEIVDCDVLVIGSGAAGLTAASRLAEFGDTKILLVEKTPFVGGTSAMCGGQWAVSQTILQQQNNIQDSDQLFLEDMLSVGRFQNDPELLKVFIKASREQYEWVLEHGVFPISIGIASGMSVPRAHTFYPARIVQLLMNTVRKSGSVTIKTGWRATKLLQSGSDGHVCGAVIRAHGEDIHIRAKAILIASGGFARNPELMNKYVPLLRGAISVSAIGAQGDGLVMAQMLGAATDSMNSVKASYGFLPQAAGIQDFSSVYYAGGIIVNSSGMRFVNEALSYKELGAAALQQSQPTFIVFDDAIRKFQMRQRPIDRQLWAPIDLGITPDYVFQGNDLMKVALKAGIDPVGLLNTVKAYNENIDRSTTDSLGRTSLSSGWGSPVKIHKPPYFIMPAVAGVMGTYCGLSIDTQARVLKEGGRPIPGLYAAGEVIGGIHGENYMTGSAFAKANAFGLIAARSIEQFIKNSIGVRYAR